MNHRNSNIPSCIQKILLTAALIATILSSADHNNNPVVEAAKLTSLGATFENNNVRDKSVPVVVDERGSDDDAGEEDYFVDLSNYACGPDFSPGDSPPATCESHYGVDRSFPIHHATALPVDDDHDHWSKPLHLDTKRKFYDDFMAGCRERYHPEGFKCDGSERERIEMNLRQPASMFNYTKLGFHKVRAPAATMALLSKFWNQKFTSVESIANETWSPGDTHTNHWSSPTKMVNLDRPLRKAVWDASKPLLEGWTGAELTPTSLYGARVYTEGAVLAPHVDRMPLVISAIINVAQDVDEPWPLEVYGHDGKAYNITMDVGDMVFYESHSVVHGRPFPLKGRYYSNVFIHFEPLGHTLQHEEEHERDRDEESDLAHLYERARKKLQTKCSDDGECKDRVDLNVDHRVPHYIVPGSEEEWRWVQTHPKARPDTSKDKDWVKSLNAHTAASNGDLDALIALAAKNPENVKHKDNNGWTPLHEAVRGGHVDVVKFLLKGGLDKNERTHNGSGGSPLWWAKKTHGHKHPMVQYLESIGAEETPPAGHSKIVKAD